MPWDAAWRSCPAWTQEHVELLEASARGSNPKNWHCRIDPLPLNQVVAIETKGYCGRAWRKFKFDENTRLASLGNGYLGVLIGGRIFASRRCRYPNGLEGCQVMPPFVVEVAA